MTDYGITTSVKFEAHGILYWHPTLKKKDFDDVTGIYIPADLDWPLDQLFGINAIKRKFKVNKDSVVTTVPTEFEIYDTEDIYVLKFNKKEIMPEIIRQVKKDDICAYWNGKSFIIASNKKYKSLLQKMAEGILSGNMRILLKYIEILDAVFTYFVIEEA